MRCENENIMIKGNLLLKYVIKQANNMNLESQWTVWGKLRYNQRAKKQY